VTRACPRTLGAESGGGGGGGGVPAITIGSVVVAGRRGKDISLVLKIE